MTYRAFDDDIIEGISSCF